MSVRACPVPLVDEPAQPIREDEKARSGGYPLQQAPDARVERASLDLLDQVLWAHERGHVRKVQQPQALGLPEADGKDRGEGAVSGEHTKQMHGTLMGVYGRWTQGSHT